MYKLTHVQSAPECLKHPSKRPKEFRELSSKRAWRPRHLTLRRNCYLLQHCKSLHAYFADVRMGRTGLRSRVRHVTLSATVQNVATGNVNNTAFGTKIVSLHAPVNMRRMAGVGRGEGRVQHEARVRETPAPHHALPGQEQRHAVEPKHVARQALRVP